MVVIRYSNPKGATKRSPSDSTKRSSGRSRNRAPPETTRAQSNKIFEDFRAGRLTQAQAVGSLRGSSAQTFFQTKLAEQQKAAAEQRSAVQARMAAKTTRDLTIIEQQRINNLKQNARKNQVVVRDSSGKIKRIKNTYFKAGNKVVENINYITGKSFIRTFKNGRLSGGLSSNITKGGGSSVTTNNNTEYKKFQNQLKSVEKYLPVGVSYQKDARGNIVNIDDKKKGINFNLNAIVNYVSADKLVAANLVVKVKEPVEKKAGFLSSIASSFSPNKWRSYREKQRQKYYDLYGLRGNKRNFSTLVNVIQSGKVPIKNKTVLVKYAMRDLSQDLMNPDVATRAEAAMIIATIASGPLIGATIGTIYKSPKALAKDKGVEGLQNLTWKDVGKKAGFSFGKNAVEAYLMMKLFGFGSKAISKIPIGGLSLKLSGANAVRLSAGGMFTEQAIKTSLRKGLDVLGAKYLSSLGIDAVKVGRSIKGGKYKAATVGASALLGSIVGFYGEKAVKNALRKVLLREDPRLILTKGTKSKPFAIENRQITLARLNKAQSLLKKGKKLKIGFAKASPVKEPRTKKIVTPEKRTLRDIKIDVPTPSGYATYAVGKNIYLVPRTFLRIRKGNTPKSYYTEWFKSVKKKGLLPTFKELGFPKTRSPTIYKGSGEYLPRNKGESLKAYYARGQRIANRLKKVQVVASPKTVLGSTQPELEIKTIYPNPKGVKASVTRVKVGKDGFGHDIVVEIIAPKTLLQRIKFKIKSKVKFKVEAAKLLIKTRTKIAKGLVPRIIQNYNFIYKSKTPGSAKARKHMLKVEQNFRRILKQYKIKASDAEIKAVSRLHDILKLRGINFKDEPLIKRALLKGYLNEIPLIKKLNAKELRRVANTIGFHQDSNPKTLGALRLDKFTRAFINADRLDITRYGIKVNIKKLFNLKSKKLIPKNIRKEFAKLEKLRIKKKITTTLRKRYNAMVNKYPALKGKTFENKIITENKARYKKMSSKHKAKIRSQERDYTDYKEASAKYRSNNRHVNKGVIPYRNSNYKSYKTPKYKAAYRSGYTDGYKSNPKINSKYNTKYKTASSAYRSGYTDGKSSYKIISRYKPKTIYKPRTTYKFKGKKKTPVAIVIPKKFKQKKLKKAVDVYYVKEKVRGRILNLNPRPLPLKEARDFLAYRIDNRLSKSAWFEPLGKSKDVLFAPKVMKGYFLRNKAKLRPFKIRVGKKRAIRNGYIEKRKFFRDTPGENKQLKRLRKPLTLSQKKALVARLRKGRMKKRK